MSSNRNYSLKLELATTAEKTEISRNMNGVFFNEDWNITQLLSMLPKKKVSKNFDRKMAAAFSLEIEREILQKNLELIKTKNY